MNKKIFFVILILATLVNVVNATPIFNYIQYNYKEALIDYLNKHKDAINIRDDKGMTPLIYTVWVRTNAYETAMIPADACWMDMIKYLISKGADVNARDKDGKTPLMYAIYPNGGIYIIKYLISKGADVNARDKDGKTPLMYAAVGYRNNLNIVKYLISKGADVNARDKDGKTVLGIVKSWQTKTMIDYLKKIGAKE